MLIVSRSDANKLINEDSNVFKTDERNRDVNDYSIKEIKPDYTIPDYTIPDYTIQEIKHGRGLGTENLTPEMRAIIAQEAIVSGRTAEDVAREYGVSTQAVEAYKNGATSLATYNQPDAALKTVVNEAKDVIKIEAQNKLLLAIQALTGEKITSAKARDIASIAKDMSSIVRDSREANQININGGQTIVYAPRVKEEDDYKVVEVRE